MSIRQDFKDFISNENNIRRLPTGITNFDNALDGGLPTGLTILGARTGLGKTTFVLQLADNLIKQANTKVLFFSLELNKFELLTKSLSRLSYFDNELTTHTPNSFVKNEVENIDTYFDKYEEYGNNIFLIDSIRDLGGIIANIKHFCKNHPNDKVVVIVDYIQYIDYNILNDKQKVDVIIKALKTLSSNMNIPIIAISSLSRDGSKKNDISSFKESGSIEYTADYGIILTEKEQTTNRLAFDTDDDRSKTITLTFLKNRFNFDDFSFDMKYYGQYATFIEI